MSRAAFVTALERDPYDKATRGVFADWLEESGLDDEAAAQRAWSAREEGMAQLQKMADEMNRHYREKYERYRKEYPDDCTVDYDDDKDSTSRKVSLDDLIEAGRQASAGGVFCFARDDDPDYMHTHNERFWLHWFHAAAQEPPPAEDGRKRTAFRCAC